MASSVRTAVFPVAGLGTRFLPATKATPKELLPVIDTPLIQYAIDEAQAAGVERMVFVSHPSKSAIERHVMDDAKLRRELRNRGKRALADELAEIALKQPEDDVIFAMQHEQLGLGHAVLCAKPHVLDGPFAVVLPDDLILGAKGCLSEMIEAFDAGARGNMVATMTVRPDETEKYGILSVVEQRANLLSANGMVEKPVPGSAPSQEAVVGRYILDPSIFRFLENQQKGAGGEIQLTDAISRSVSEVDLYGLRFSGTRFDCGSKGGMFRALLHVAEGDPELQDILAEAQMSAAGQRAA